MNRYLTIAGCRLDAALLPAWNAIKAPLHPVLSPLVRPWEDRWNARRARQYMVLAHTARDAGADQAADMLAEAAAERRLR